MVKVCFECNREIGNTSLIFKKSDLVINHISIPKQMTEADILCVNCYDQRLKSPTTNLSKARIDKLVNIYEKEMDKNKTIYVTNTKIKYWIKNNFVTKS